MGLFSLTLSERRRGGGRGLFSLTRLSWDGREKKREGCVCVCVCGGGSFH